MNCGEFQDGLFEYVEGTLSANENAAAEKHLAECGACRKAVQSERQRAQFLSRELEQTTAGLKLDADARKRIAAALSRETVEGRSASEKSIPILRLAWPMALAASILIVAILSIGILRRQKEPTTIADPTQPAARSEASIQMSYVVPAHTFRREGDLVVDALTYTTNVVNQTLWVRTEN